MSMTEPKSLIMLDACLYLAGLKSPVNNVCPVLPSHLTPALTLNTLWSSLFYRLPHLPISAPSAHLYSIFPLIFLAWKCTPLFFAILTNSSAFVSFSVFSQPSSPDNMLGPSKDDRTVPSTGWVRRQLKNPSRRAQTPRTPTGLQQHQLQGTTACLLWRPWHIAH